MISPTERGSVLIETALVGVVVMALSLGLIQFGLWFHGQHVVLGAAQDGAHAAALEGATADAGAERARGLVTTGLGRTAAVTNVSARHTDRLAIVTVEATMPSIVPFLPTMSLRAEAHAFRERFVAEGDLP